MNFKPLTTRLTMVGLSPFLFAGGLLTAARYVGACVQNPAKALSIAYMVDQTSNVAVNGRVDEAISARAAKARNAGKRWGCVLCKLLDSVQAGHCNKALAADTHNPTPGV